MTCRVCKHWKGDVYDWDQDGQRPVKGPCWRDPVPVETLSTYVCAAISVSPEIARHWLHMYHLELAYRKKYKAELEATKATLERVRARVRNLKNLKAAE